MTAATIATNTCPHCGAVHSRGLEGRCPSTGLPIGGDPTLVGRIVADRYHVVRLLGDGGMGAVYKAIDQRLSRFVALKVLHSHLIADNLLVERLSREARSAAAIGHPNIVDVLDFTQDAAGPVIVMEYLKGHSLASLIERVGPLRVERAGAILTHTLAGLAAAHERGVIHRDLKPANLMVVKRLSDKNFVKVCDFGFATFVEPTQNGAFDLTPAHTLVGTPSYAAPERWIGDTTRDPRTDIYSAGVILYEVLAGKRPFAGDKVSELVRQIRNDKPPSLRAMRSDVPQALEDIVFRALAKNREERWASAVEFAEALIPFGGHRVEQEPAEEVDVFTEALSDIRAREAKLQGQSEIVEVSISDALPEVIDSAGARAFTGNVALAILRFLRLSYGEARTRATLESLPSGSRELFQSEIKPDQWVPYDALRELMEHIDKTIGYDDLRFVVQCGRATAEGLFEMRAELEPTAPTPHETFRAMPSLGEKLVRGVRYVVHRAGVGHGRMEVVEDTDQPSITGCVATLGFLERSLVRAGASDVEVNLLSCRALNDERCMFDATWIES